MQTDVANYAAAIKNTFRLQAALGDDPESLKELAAEIRDLSQKKKASETALEDLKGQEHLQADVDDAIDDLKGGIDSFRRGFTKATAMTKKSLIQSLIHTATVTQKGLSIQYRLKHGLNPVVASHAGPTAPSNESNVFSLANHRRNPPDGAASESEFRNVRIVGSRVEGNGSERRT